MCTPDCQKVVNDRAIARISDFGGCKGLVSAHDDASGFQLTNVEANCALGQTRIQRQAKHSGACAVSIGTGIVRHAQKHEPCDRFCHILLLNRPRHCLNAQCHDTY